MGQISKRLRNGIVLMIYENIGDFDDRDYDLESDFDFKHWWCMNGQVSGIPNLIDKYPRCESVAGNEDGHNDDEVISHNHSIGNGGVSHDHGGATDASGTHDHSFSTWFIIISSDHGWWLAGNMQNNGAYYYTSTAPDHTHSMQSTGGHTHTLQNPSGGISLTDANRPASTSLNFIKRKR